VDVLLFAVEAGPPDNPILPEISEMVWGAVAFFTLWALVKFVLLPPVRSAMEARAEKGRAGV